METKRYMIFIFVIAFLVTPFCKSFAQTVYDVFPLAKNLHYKYLLESRYRYQELVYLMALSVDSGTVEYVIQDSTRLADTAIVWTVKQSEHLWHRRFSGTDTSYWTDKDTIISLIENLAGKHALRCSSWVWNSPLANPSDTLFRYSDTEMFVLGRQYPPPTTMSGTVDTLYFKNIVGLYRRIRDSQFSGISHVSSSLSITQLGTPTHVRNEVLEHPRLTKLRGNYPNPFNGSTTISYSLAERSWVTFSVFDLLGREFLRIAAGNQAVGEHSFPLDAQALPTGIYFYKLWANGETLTSRFVLIK